MICWMNGRGFTIRRRFAGSYTTNSFSTGRPIAVTIGEQTRSRCLRILSGAMFNDLLYRQYGLHIHHAQHALTGVGSDTWLLTCTEGDYVLKFPASGAIDHPEAEPKLCAFLRRHDIPACAFLKNHTGGYLSLDSDGRMFTVQQRFPGHTPPKPASHWTSCFIL